MFKQLLAVLVPVFMLAVLAAPALAISAPSVAFIPDKVSANGAFIMIADPHQAQDESLIVVWEKDYGTGEINNKGSFPRVSGKYVCYFSNADNESTCGPAPFKVIDPARKFFVTAINKDNTSGTTVANLSVGDIQIQPTSFVGGGGRNISIRWPISTFEPSALYYKAYYANNFTETSYSGSALSSGYGYAIDIPAGPGAYFVSLRIDHSGTGRFGGTILRVSIPESGIYLPGGEFLPSSLIVTPASFEVLLNKNQNYQKTGFSITNTGTIPVGNITTEMPSGLGQYISVSFSNSTITPNGTIFYTITVGGAQHSLSINTKVNITSNNITIGQIPLNVNVSIVNECEGAAPSQCPSREAGGISIDQQTWTGDYLAGQPATFNFTITNLGNATLSNFSHSSSFGYSLSVQMPGTLLPKRYAAASAKLDQSYAGKQSGYITIVTPNGSASIAVSLNFHEDISSSITDLEAEYADFQSSLSAQQRASLASVFADIDSDISSAESAQESGSYENAKSYYTKASAKLSALDDVFPSGGASAAQPSGGIDMTTVLIIVIVVAAGAVAFIIIRRRRGGGGEEELEEELAEDFGPLPPAEG